MITIAAIEVYVSESLQISGNAPLAGDFWF
jgi:hypothetical protein